MKNKTFIKYSIILASLLLAGCAGYNKTSVPTINPSVYKEGQVDYFFQPGDTLDIKFLYNPELNESVIIRPDGKISLQMIDETRASGLTPAQLNEALTKAYSSQLKQPRITVIVRSFGGQRIYVGGEVNTPRTLTVNGKVDALQAIMDAGGFKPDAKPSSVMIISKDKENRPVVRKVDLKKVLKGAPSTEDFTLKPFDVVYVPKTELATADEFMTHIYNFIPRNIYFGFNYDVHTEFQDNNNNVETSGNP
jgi:protein involved in polysaccharide export with SLBB domain